ncbi:nitroreductase family deazaflavin-dependent oxidoreductase [Mycobacterium sp. MYCO198283]|uniref:nitroreductase family deazaflavin-dependent oxidoreductase n=1 Tax=Mycobacterium sp. MYCO198283 TaxID=2883505 RepID=UPI001E53FD83|nr:nitroreductase family deazaflavin-dependent oxidoreductase [Mycobacterium sp. MYCO198283]MCG5430739.1 nitroreductase family deazaflavin-dependent oxidoreductase [Mycobacterium sp. MYCO198283]
MDPRLEKIALRFLRLHDLLYRRSGGRIGHRVPGQPNSLLLHSTGAKSGEPRTHTLSYAKDGSDYLIVASNGGARRNPAWYHNVKAHPDVEINVGTRRFPVHATIVGPDDSDYPRLWRIVNANNHDRYTAYQRRTSRPIAVIRLRPV